ncbi:hypothetical protein ABPG72_012828 [Tetrahymena utriculariae]
MFVGSNVDQLRVRPGLTNINMEVNQPLSVTKTQIIRSNDNQQLNNAEILAQQEMQKSMLRESKKQENLEKFQKTIVERAAIIEKENKLKKLEEDRLKEEKKQFLLSRNKKTFGQEEGSIFSVPEQREQTFAKKKETQTIKPKAEEDKKKKEPNMKLSVVFKANEEVQPSDPRNKSQSPKAAKKSEVKTSSGYNPQKKNKKQNTHAQMIIPVVRDDQESESEDEIDYDICNFTDAEEAVTKYQNIRQHLYSLTCNKKY